MTGALKSQDEFYLGLHLQLIRHIPLALASSVKNSAISKDVDVARHRTFSEGLAFLTKTLPSLGKALDQALVSCRFNIPRGFAAQRDGSRPRFLGAYFNLIFDENGFLRDVVPVAAVKHLRQVLYFAYKLEIPFSAAQNAEVIRRFVATEKELESLVFDPLAERVIRLAKIITRKVFRGFNHKDIHPQHGPGAVATGEKLERKWEFSRLYNQIHQTYPYYVYYVVGGAIELSDRLDWYKSLQRLETGSAKVVLVPKDSRGPRLISCEPLEYQWIQQGLGRKISAHLESRSRHTRGRINFTSQEINRNLAKTSSASQRFATLDLKDASDRVSLELVRRVFSNTPGLLRGLEACRTTSTTLPSGEVIFLNKFAPMGSALCFPVEAFVFWSIMVGAVVDGLRLPLQRVESSIYVYGDDIVIPVEWVELCTHALESVGLVVNMDKSCVTGFFRESCGMDAFRGEDVTPSRLRKQWTNRSTDGSSYASYVSLANKMQDDYGDVSDLIWAALEKLYGNMPYGTSRASYPCRIVADPAMAVRLNSGRFRRRSNRKYQRVEFFLPSLSSRRMRSGLDGWLRLTRNLVFPPFGDPSVIVLPRSIRIKRGWAGVG